jgi:hypothetical protein
MNIKTAPWILLFGRTVLFILVQSIFALGFLFAGSTTAWEGGADWWIYGVTITNLICLSAMISLFRAEGKNYWGIFRIQRETVGRDLATLLGLMFIIGPVSYFPNIWLANALFDNPQNALDLILRPLPLWAVYVGIVAFPVTQGLVELALYFLYVMPRLDSRPFPELRPLLLPGLMLGFQHLAVPLLFNPPFILWRALMYIPFAFAVGLILHWRPRLLPYLAVIHTLMDMSFAAIFLMVAS